jgi:hypothetical protein
MCINEVYLFLKFFFFQSPYSKPLFLKFGCEFFSGFPLQNSISLRIVSKTLKLRNHLKDIQYVRDFLVCAVGLSSGKLNFLMHS